MITRRKFFTTAAIVTATATATGGYAVAETFGCRVTNYQLTPPTWTPGLKVRLAVIADVHACKPWMSPKRIANIVAQTNALNADVILLLGDYVSGHRIRKIAEPVAPAIWAAELAKLKAPLGVHAVLGNHDWWDDYEVQKRMSGPTPAGQALQAVGIKLYQNDVLRLEKDGHPFWLAGLGDQWAFYPKRYRAGLYYKGVDDLPATLAKITDDAPVVLMAHEPDIFPKVPARVALTLAGHTHGGQVRILGYAPIVPSIYHDRYVYGHIIEDKRHLIVSGGLGVSQLPIRLGSPPEIVTITLGEEGTAS